MLSYTVDFKAPRELWNPLGKAIPGKSNDLAGIENAIVYKIEPIFTSLGYGKWFLFLTLLLSSHMTTLERAGQCHQAPIVQDMMTSSNENIFRVTGPLCVEFTGDRWISPTKASDAELWCFLWSAPKQTAEQTIEMPVIWDAITLIIMSL